MGYIEAVRRVLDHLEGTQAEPTSQAADLVIRALRGGGAVFCSEVGHGIQGDFLNRAGGLAALQALSFGMSVTDPVAACLSDRPRPGPVQRDIELVRLAVGTGNLRRGDVVVIGSVSGRNLRPVELALSCGDAGIATIGLTSMAYTANVVSLHPSGKRLCDAVDVVVDIGAPYGDAAVDIAGMEVTVLPVSGVGFAVAGWMIWEQVISRMASEGDPPTVFMSVNREGGQAYYEEARRRYNERGY
jgi:uncharacterized phosphosugar-binding protein